MSLKTRTDIKSNTPNTFADLTLGITKTLEKRKGVSDVQLAKQVGVERSQILTWEQKNSCLMMEDLKNFYLTSNGLCLTWSIKIKDNKIPLGKMEINPLERLVRLGGVGASNNTSPGLLDIVDSDDENNFVEAKPKFNHKSRIFELDACDGYGKVCYVYNNARAGIAGQKAEIWFLDRSLQWHYLADNFLNYFRLMITHLGLPHWQYAFTDIGLPTESQQWFNLFCPMRTSEIETSQFVNSSSSTSHFSTDKVFRSKGEKKKPTAQTLPQNINKKKVPAPAARQTSSGQLKPLSQGQITKSNR